MELDLVIRGGTVVTAAAVGKSDAGVKNGRIVALAENLPRAASEIDASGLCSCPAESTVTSISTSRWVLGS
jgi:dihydropyrimidinase